MRHVDSGQERATPWRYLLFGALGIAGLVLVGVPCLKGFCGDCTGLCATALSVEGPAPSKTTIPWSYLESFAIYFMILSMFTMSLGHCFPVTLHTRPHRIL